MDYYLLIHPRVYQFDFAEMYIVLMLPNKNHRQEDNY